MRFVIVDYNHLVYKTMNLPQFSYSVVTPDGVLPVDTTVPYYTIAKDIWRFSGYGAYPTAVCLEGGSEKRRDYFQKSTYCKDVDYKANRKKMPKFLRDGIDLSVNVMVSSNISCYRVMGYEADDMVYSVTRMLKEKYPDCLIDIFTNDRDLLPLVDDTVSVYIKSMRDHNDNGSPAVRGYFQVTPNSWNMYVSLCSEYKNFLIPYNAVLIYKLIRGDKADNIPPIARGFGSAKFNSMMAALETSDVSMYDDFRYGVDFENKIAPVFRFYYGDDFVNLLRDRYYGFELSDVRSTVAGLSEPRLINSGTLTMNLSKLGIHLKI